MKSCNRLAVAIWRNSKNIGQAPRESAEEGQQDSMQSSVVTGDKGRLDNWYMCLRLQGTTKTCLQAKSLLYYYARVLSSQTALWQLRVKLVTICINVTTCTCSSRSLCPFFLYPEEACLLSGKQTIQGQHLVYLYM